MARVILGRVANNTSILGLMPVLVSKRRTNAPLSVPDQLSHVYLRRFGLALLLFSPYLYQYCRYLRVSLYKEDFARIIQKLCSRWKQESEFSATNLGVALYAWRRGTVRILVSTASSVRFRHLNASRATPKAIELQHRQALYLTDR